MGPGLMNGRFQSPLKNVVYICKTAVTLQANFYPRDAMLALVLAVVVCLSVSLRLSLSL